MGRTAGAITVVVMLGISIAAIFGGISGHTISDIDIGSSDRYWIFQTSTNVTCSTPLGVGEGKILIPCSDSTFAILDPNGTISEKIENEGCGITPDPAFLPGLQLIIGALDGENAIGAFDLNGSLIWRFDLEYGLPDVKIGLSDDGLILFCDLEPTLHLLSSNGSEIWKREVNSIAWNPIFGDEIVVILTDGPRIQAFSRQNGSLLWNDYSMGTPYSSYCGPSIGSDGTIYAAVGHFDHHPGYLCSYDQQGNVLWKSEIWGNCWERLRQILISSDGERIYLPMQRGIRELGPSPDYTKWLSEEVGEEILAFGTDGQVLWTGGYPGLMTFDNESDVVYTYLDEVYALNDEGQIKWKFNLPIDGDSKSPHILTNIDGTIYIGGTILYDIGEGDYLWMGFVVALTSEPPGYIPIPIFPLLLIILVPVFLIFLRVYWKK